MTFFNNMFSDISLSKWKFLLALGFLCVVFRKFIDVLIDSILIGGIFPYFIHSLFTDILIILVGLTAIIFFTIDRKIRTSTNLWLYSTLVFGFYLYYRLYFTGYHFIN